jgi:DNA polymerase III delta prime subunit
MHKKNSPWVEKYRPTNFDDIVLEPLNRTLLTNIIETNNFPNLLFYGPPGTGKTTTIINLINAYQEKNGQKRKGLKIHLNASDDRGIDIIRNQIKTFVDTKTLFGKGIKFVILDEVDYMTKNAQQALRYLIQQYINDIRFCLICNYISRIDMSLQNEFVRLRFCQLPKKDISHFLLDIVNKEDIKITQNQLSSIQNYFKSDIRSMINYIQSNHSNNMLDINVIKDNFWVKLLKKMKNTSHEKLIQYMKNKCLFYNIQPRQFIIKLFIYLIYQKKNILKENWINNIEFILHNNNVNESYLINYAVVVVQQFVKEE